MHTLASILSAIPWFAWIPIVAIICGAFNGAICTITKHNERMAMIRMGMHPDAKVEKPYYEEQEV
jgi:ABC-type nitrate/sulfonate/bicarbonate transport system permease component